MKTIGIIARITATGKEKSRKNESSKNAKNIITLHACEPIRNIQLCE